MDDEYTCYMCENKYIKELTEKEAEEQLKKEFPGHTKDGCVLICDDCYNAMQNGKCYMCGKDAHPGFFICMECLEKGDE